MDMWRQGDVIIRPLMKQVEDKMDEKKDLVLAEGEVSGHRHRITKGEVQLKVNAMIGIMILKVLSKQAILFHEEHGDIILPMGDYEVKTQRELDWFSEEVRRVAD